MKILLTGGLGYIGSHTAVELLENNYEIVIIDNLSNSNINVKDKIKKITGKDFDFYLGDVRDEKILDRVFEENDIGTIIHFAGFKAVGESVKLPVNYYDNNLISTIKIIESMQKHNVKNLIFSSSATVYGLAEKMPIEENFPVYATNPYGRTKLFIEEILKDLSLSDKTINITILRYFNPVGAHPSGIIGEDPNGIPNNLMPYITRVALGKLPQLSVYGNDYNTKDGTGVRDYLHVVDLAQGHVKALEKIRENNGLKIYNLGTGVGYSVLDVINAFEKSTGVRINYKITDRRPGDIDICYASAKKAKDQLGWQTTHSLEDMCLSSYLFEKNNTK